MASAPTEPAPQPPSLSGVEVQSWQNRALEERSRRRYRLFAPSSSESAGTTPPAPDSVAASVGLESPRESTAMVSHSDPTQPRVVTPSSRLPSTPLAPLTRRAQLWLRLRPHVSALLKAGLAGRDAVGPYWTVAPPRRFRATLSVRPFCTDRCCTSSSPPASWPSPPLQCTWRGSRAATRAAHSPPRAVRWLPARLSNGLTSTGKSLGPSHAPRVISVSVDFFLHLRRCWATHTSISRRRSAR